MSHTQVRGAGHGQLQGSMSLRGDFCAIHTQRCMRSREAAVMRKRWRPGRMAESAASRCSVRDTAEGFGLV